MNKVATINLNGKAYQLEEAGYEAVRAYLDVARLALAENPDRDEIMRDLEQALVDKFGRFLDAHKTVVTEAEVAQAIDEMGPVDSSTNSEQAASTPGEQGRIKKLYRIPTGAVFAGVASGLAAYFDLDVVLIRVIFVLLTILTGGAFVAAYIIMMILIPRAHTPQEMSRAHGTPFSAQEVIDRMHRSFEDVRTNTAHWREDRNEWKRQWREEKRRSRWEARHDWHHHHHHHSVLGELFQVAFIVLVLWAVYTYIPKTQSTFHTVGDDVQQGWAWLNAKVVR
jgi:phage shock protein PspC (stress-responsive transcriptional regulator)